MIKKMDDLFFRVVSVLIAFLALRGPVKDSASTELLQAMGFTDDFFLSAYLAVAHIILTFLGSLLGAYFDDFRLFDEAAILSGFAMCFCLVMELYSHDTLARLGFFTKCFSIALFGLIIILVVPSYAYSHSAQIAQCLQNMWGRVSGFWDSDSLIVFALFLGLIGTCIGAILFYWLG